MHGELRSDDLVSKKENQYNEAYTVRHKVVSSPYQCEGAVVDSSNLARQYTTH